MDLDKAIRSRKSVRKFSNKTPDWRKIVEAIDFAKYAPMAGNNFTLKFILVDDKEKIQKITDAAQQAWITQSKYLVVVCSDEKRLNLSYGKKGLEYNKQQVGAAIQNFLLKLEDCKLSTCWIGYFDERQVKEILNIPEGINVEALFPIGYETHVKYSRKAKINLDNFLYFNKYGDKKMRVPRKINA